MNHSVKKTEVSRITELIMELNHLSNQRKNLLDQQWLLEDRGEAMRNELMKLLRHI